MKIYDLTCELDGFVSFLFKNLEENDKWAYPMFSGEPLGTSYPVPIGVRDHEDGPPYPETLPDFTQMGLKPIPTFSERAVHTLGAMLTAHGEFASIQLDEPIRYFGFNPTTIVNVLDESRSKIIYFSNGRVMEVEQHVLLEEVKTLPPIFKIPQTRRNTTYVNEDFVNRARATRLTGFRFNLVFER